MRDIIAVISSGC